MGETIENGTKKAAQAEDPVIEKVTDFLNKRTKEIHNGRHDFARVSGSMELPNLCDVQTESYRSFIEKGVEEEFEDFFPIGSTDPKIKDDRRDAIDYTKEMVLDYVHGSIRWSEPQPEGGPYVAKEKNKSYSRKIFATLSLHMPDGTITEEEVFFGDIPAMTDSGTFIINGAERCIISQIVRSPGAYISDDSDEKSGHQYGADIIPQRGTWLEFETDAKGLLNVRIDKQRKVSAVTLLRALGLVSPTGDENQVIYDMFGTYSENLVDTLEKTQLSDGLKSMDGKKRWEYACMTAVEEIYTKLRPGEPVTEAGAVKLLQGRFFNRKQYSLGRAGRFKLTEKLGIYNRLAGVTLAEDLDDSETGEVYFEKGHEMTREDVRKLREMDYFAKNKIYDGADPECFFHANIALDSHAKVNIVHVFGKLSDEDVEEGKEAPVISIVGTDTTLTVSYVTPSDIFAIFSYMLNIMYGDHSIGKFDDIDNLSNRRVKSVGELLQEHFRQGLTRMEKNIRDRMLTLSNSNNTDEDNVKKITPTKIVNIKPLTSNLKDFFNSSQLSQFMDQTNPLAELTNKRRLSALGPGGLSRDRASFKVRDVQPTHYGRICPIETPEGQNVGLINYLACYAKIDEHGFITTPYRPVHDTIIDQDPAHVVYMTAAEEVSHWIAQANVNIETDEKGNSYIADPRVVARHEEETVEVDSHDVDYIDVSPKQIVSIASACIPFLESDDTTRALLGSNMERQALPLLRPHAPFVGTGMEHKIARDSGTAVICKKDGVVTYEDSSLIIVKSDDGEVLNYHLRKFSKANQATCINQTPIVHIGQKVKKGEIIADGPAMQNGDLALGQNMTIAFMTWHGYDYEDAVVMNERCRRDDTFTSLHIDEYTIDRRRQQKLGAEEFTREVPNASEEAKAHLDARGVVIPGTVVKEGDILVGKITPKGETSPTAEEKLLMSIFADKSKEGKDTSLRVQHGGGGIVQDVKFFSAERGDVLPPNVIEQIKVYVVQKRKITEGDKMSGRHGNKGVISKLVPTEDMPYLADGTPVDLCLNPLGVPSRMNIGQVIEIHLGQACRILGKKLAGYDPEIATNPDNDPGIKVATPVFDGVKDDDLTKLMQYAGLEKDGKCVVYDGQTGERFENRIAVGTMYMIKLDHMVADKVHARAIGPYSLVTQQPLGGKAQRGGQRFGEMEVWALEAYGASHVLQEMLTIKSDDMVGRNKCYEAILKGKPIPDPSMPESFRVLLKELQGLAINVQLLDKDNKPIDLDSLVLENAKENRSLSKEIKNFSIENESKAEERRARNAENGTIELDEESAEMEDDGTSGSIITEEDVKAENLADQYGNAADDKEGE